MLPGTQKVLQALQRDDTTPADIAQRLEASRRLGVPSTVGDVGGPNTQALATAVTQKPGPGVQNYVDSTIARMKGTPDRVHELVNRALAPDDYLAQLDKLQQALYSNAKPLYDAAYGQFPSVNSPQLMEVLDTPAGKRAARRAVTMMRNAREPIGNADVTGMVHAPSLKFWDYFKRGLDDTINKAERTGYTGEGKILRGMRNTVRDELDRATTLPNGVSPYAAARQQYAGDLEVRDALQTGRDKFLTMTNEALRRTLDPMSFAEKDAFRSGAAESLFNQANKAGNPARRLLNLPGVAQKYQALFDKPSDYQRFMDGLSQEADNFDRARTRVAMAARARNASAAQEISEWPGLGEGSYEATLALAGHPEWAGARIARSLARRMMPKATADEASSLLGLTAGPEARNAMRLLQEQGERLSAARARVLHAGTQAGSLAGFMATPAPWGNRPGQRQSPGGFARGGLAYAH